MIKKRIEISEVNINNVYYMIKNYKNKSYTIKLFDKEYIVKDKRLINKLKRSLIQIHYSCFINKDKILTVDYANNYIIFDNNEKIEKLSKKYNI